MISSHLKEFRFLPAYKNTKTPIRKVGVSDMEQSLSYEEALKLNVPIECNVCITGGKYRDKTFILIDLDLDKLDFNQKSKVSTTLFNILKNNTYVENTCSGGLRIPLIYKGDKILDNFNLKLDDIDCGEFRVTQMITIIAPSVAESKVDKKLHPYTIQKDFPVLEVTDEQIEEIKSTFKASYLSTDILNVEIETQNTSISKDELDLKILDVTSTKPLIQNLIFGNPLDINDDRVKKMLKEDGTIDRSAVDMKVTNFLMFSGLGSYIKAIHQIYPIGEKYREKGSNGDKYLEMMIKKSQKFTGIKNSSYIELAKKIVTEDSEKLRQNISEVLSEIHSKVKSDIYVKYLLALLSSEIQVHIRDLQTEFTKIKLALEQKANLISRSGYELLMDESLDEKVELLGDKLIPKGCITIVGGKVGNGKSLLLLNLILKILQENSNTKILLKDMENDSGKVLKTRIKYLVNGLNFNASLLKNLIIEDCFETTNLKNEVERAKEFDIVVLDSYRRCLPGSENDSEVSNIFYTDYLKQLKNLKKTVIIIHHLKKEIKSSNTSSTEDFNDLFRGSTDLPAQVDLTILIKKEDDFYDDENQTTNFMLQVLKGKNRIGIPFRNFKYKVIRNDVKGISTFNFSGYIEKQKSPEENAKVEILELVKKNKSIPRQFLFEELKHKYPNRTTDRYLNELVESNQLKKNKYGIYESSDSVLENLSNEI